jgi:D-glycero-alpha-D-manno-heptose-7-phosphate kinase
MIKNFNKIIRARAPLRLGLAGGGTDVSPYCDKFGGLILNATIDLYAYAVIKPLSNEKVKLISCDHNITVEKDLHGAFDSNEDLMLHKAVYKNMINLFNDSKDIALELITFCDAPAGSGLGSSSTLVVSMIKAFLAFFNTELDNYSIASLAYKIERIECKLGGGRQDQYSATFGGINYMDFNKDGNVIVNTLQIPPKVILELEATLLLFYTGISRDSAAIIYEQSRNVDLNKAESINAMHFIKEEATLMKENLAEANFMGFVESLRRGWDSKKKIAESISNSYLDEIYDVAIKAGAYAGKISGAGGGGFFMFVIPTEDRMNVKRALEKFGGQVSNCHFTKQGAESWEI